MEISGLETESVVRQLPSGVCTATPAFEVQSSVLSSGLELVTRLPARSVTFR